ncbi:MAG: site-2 protease family protein [Verrucomicrobiota bacterium]
MFRFKCFGVPVIVEWWFWLSGVLLGGGLNASTQRQWEFVGIWCAVVFVSILVHEMGHALVGRRYGATPMIKLHGFGGATYLPGAWFTRKQNILVSAAGPAAGLALGFAILLVRAAGVIPEDSIHVQRAFAYALYVNIFWSFFNLLPVQPMDGGQILGDVLGPGRIRITNSIGMVVALALAYWAWQIHQPFLLMFMLYFAYVNYQNLELEGGVIRGR